jgi:MYXO-CTERM domain-containing protein
MRIIPDSSETQSRLAIYTVIAGALTAATAVAAPTQSPLTFPLNVEDTTDDSSYEVVEIDINDDGTTDFELRARFSTTCNFNDGNLYFQGQNGGQVEITTNNYAGMIAPGASISGALTFSSYSYLAGCGSEPGNYPPPSRGTVAVKFMNGADTHYGYLKVETYAGSIGANVLNACFESDPDTPIDAGACTPPTPVPVGGAVPLALGVLTMGAAALRRRRRRH